MWYNERERQIDRERERERERESTECISENQRPRSYCERLVFPKTRRKLLFRI